MHGVDRSYRGGCRCTECRAWNAQRVRSWRAGERRRHAWREMCVEAWWLATLVREQEKEAVAVGYETEGQEYDEAYPLPRYKDTLIYFARGDQAEAA